MYESPIKLLMTDIHNQIMAQQEDAVYQAVLHYIPDIDKAELIRALKYDRDQYAKGYADGKADAEKERVRCGECKHWNDETVYHPFCNHPTSGLFTAPDDGTGFCHCGERKGGAEDV